MTELNLGDELEDHRPAENGSISLKYWQLILVIGVQVAMFAYGYGRVTQQLDDVDNRQTQIERRSNVSIEEFSDFRQEVRDDVRNLHLAIDAIGK